MIRATLALSASLVATGLVAAPAAQAQSLIVPPWAANEEGNSLDQEPFGDDTVHHLQYVDGSYLAPMAPGSMMTAIAYRADTDWARLKGATSLKRVGMPIWYLRLSNTSTSPFAATGVWPARPDTGPPVAGWPFAILAKPISFPVLTIPASGTAAFDIRLPFDQPMVFTGPHLGIDHFTYDVRGSTYPYWVDAVQQTTTGGSVTMYGGSCPSGLNRASGIAPDPGGLLEMRLYDAPLSVPAIALLGVNASNTPLGPLGMPGCSLYTEPMAQVAASTNAVGLAAFRAIVPANPAFGGAQFFAQWLVPDPRIQPMPVASSEGLVFLLGNNLTGRQVASTLVTNPGGSTAAAGFATVGRGLVFKLEWQ